MQDENAQMERADMLIDNVTRKVLDNGMTVLVREDHSAPVATVNVWVKTGYFNETDERTGISHMLEHMFFKGTPSRPTGRIQEEVKSVGGYWNAGTIYDHTNYYIVVPAGELDRALDIEADCLINSTFDAAELEKEHEVVIQEILRKYDNPRPMTWEKMLELLFRRHHLGRWRMGTPEQVRAMDRDAMLRYYTDNYRPGNIVLVVAGDVDTGAVLERIDELFGAMPRGEIRRVSSPPEPPVDGLRYRQETADITQSYLAVGFHAPPACHVDEAAAEVLARILGEGRSSRLYRRLKERGKLVNSISAGYHSLPDVGVFFIDAGLESGDMAEARKEIFSVIEKLISNGPGEAELQKVKTVAEYEFLAGMSTVSGQANMLAGFESLGGYEKLEEHLERLRAVTAADVRRVAGELLSVGRAAVQEYRPSGEGYGTTADTLSAELVAALGPEEPARDDSAADAYAVRQGNIIIKDRADTPARASVLSNGVKVIVRERHRLPLAAGGLYFEGGRMFETPGNAGITSLAAATALKGTESRGLERLQDEIAGLGSRLAARAAPDFTAFFLSGLSRNFLLAWDLLADIVINPAFPQAEFEKEKKTQLAAIIRNRDSMYYYPMMLARRAAYGDFPYGLPPSGYEEPVKELALGDAREHFERVATTGNAVAVVVGDVDTEQVLEALEEKLAGLRTPPDGPETPAFDGFRTEWKTEERQKAQSAQAFAFPAVPAVSDDIYALDVLRNIASGMGGRLYDQVREKNNLAYTVNASLELHRHAGLLMNYAATSPENEEKARELMIAEWQKLAAGDFTEDEFNNAVRFTLGIHRISLQTNADYRNRYARYSFLGRELDYIEKYPERIAALAPGDVRAAAQKYIPGADGGLALGAVRATAGSP